MALSVTPTSGAGPYTLSLDLSDKINIDNINYQLLGYVGNSEGVCGTPNGPVQYEVIESLINTGTYERPGVITSGRCVVYRFDIVDLNTSSVISSESVSLSNL